MTKIRTLIPTLLLTGLMTGLSTAHAEEDRDKREERRALKMSDMDQVDMAQQYREEARAKKSRTHRKVRDDPPFGSDQGGTKSNRNVPSG